MIKKIAKYTMVILLDFAFCFAIFANEYTVRNITDGKYQPAGFHDFLPEDTNELYFVTNDWKIIVYNYKTEHFREFKEIQDTTGYNKISVPTWSPDGKYIAYTHNSEIYIFDTIKKISRKALDSDHKNCGWSLSWKGEDQIYFTECKKINNSSSKSLINLLNIKDKTVTTIFEHKKNNYYYPIYNDRLNLLFFQNEDSSTKMKNVSFDTFFFQSEPYGTNKKNITLEGYEFRTDQSFDISYDGLYLISFTSPFHDGGDRDDIYIMNIKTGKKKIIFTEGERHINMFPRFSPNMDKIIFYSAYKKDTNLKMLYITPDMFRGLE